MTATPWIAVLSGLSPTEPVDLDDPPFDAPGSALVAAPGSETAWPPSEPASPSPSHLLYWPEGVEARAAIAIRVTRPLADPVAAALQLASAAAERDVEPVILTTLTHTGLERFGFRVEQLPEADVTEQERCEAELSAFWNFAIVVDAEDLALLS